MKHLATALVLAGGLAFAAPSAARAQTAPARPASAAVGQWVWAAAVNGEVVSEGTMRLTLTNGVLSGVLMMPEGEVPMQRVAFDGYTFSIVFQTSDNVITSEGRFVNDNLMQGTWTDAQQTSGTWSANRRTP